MGDREPLLPDDLNIIEASYRCISDADAFDDLVAAWHRRLDELEEGFVDRVETPALMDHFNNVRALFARVHEPEPEDPVSRALMSASSPAMVLSPTDVVAAANASGERVLGVRQGATSTLAWLDPASRAEYDAVRRSASGIGNRAHAVVKLASSEDRPRLAEVSVIEGDEGRGAMIAVRALDLVWGEPVEALLAEAFGLTGAEIGVARALFEEGDTGAVAKRRGVTVLTVRTQLRTIFSKTETGNQVDLIRLLAMLCARAEQGKIADTGTWQDPLFRERIFTDPAGRKVAYSWMGAKDGRPMLVMHGSVTGYVMPQGVQRALEQAGIRMWTVCRPGFGHSDPDDATDTAEAGSRVIRALLDHLKIARCPMVGLVTGIIPIVRFAADNPGRVTAALGIGGCHPLDRPGQLKALPKNQRVMLSLLRHSPGAVDLAVRAGARIVKQRGIVFMLRRMFSNCEPDIATLSDNDTVALLNSSARMLHAQGHTAFVRDLQLITCSWRRDLEAMRAPLAILWGGEDPVYRPEAAAALADEVDNVRVEVLPGRGQLLLHQAPDRVAEAILALS